MCVRVYIYILCGAVGGVGALPGIYVFRRLFKGALCAQVKRLRVSYYENEKTLRRNSLRYLSKANLTIAVY